MIAWYWALAGGWLFGNICFVAGLFFGAKQRDDYDPYEHEFPPVMPRIWKGEPE